MTDEARRRGDSTTMTLDGRTVEIDGDETILEGARRLGVEIPTLCHDPRLEPTGACRICLVEVEGQRRLVPSCATAARPGMAVRTEGERIARHRRALLALYLADHSRGRSAVERDETDELWELARRYGAPDDWGRLPPVRAARDDDANPYIHFHAEQCIVCARCVRYCDEVEGVSAIALSGRGSATTISTVDALPLLDTTCELCGGCIDVCPTGAMTEKMPVDRRLPPEEELEKVRTTCSFCGVGCQLDLCVDRSAREGGGRVVKVTAPPPGTTTNDGNLCVKGRFAFDFIDHPERLTAPLLRGPDGALHEASWEEATRRAADGLLGIRQRHGADALGFISSSRCTGEESYLVQKLARAVFATNNVHQCAAT
jgi:predicted molibdopterin-dependent oxidoreductase YjgC